MNSPTIHPVNAAQIGSSQPVSNNIETTNPSSKVNPAEFQRRVGAQNSKAASSSSSASTLPANVEARATNQAPNQVSSSASSQAANQSPNQISNQASGQTSGRASNPASALPSGAGQGREAPTNTPANTPASTGPSSSTLANSAQQSSANETAGNLSQNRSSIAGRGQESASLLSGGRNEGAARGEVIPSVIPFADVASARKLTKSKAEESAADEDVIIQEEGDVEVDAADGVDLSVRTADEGAELGEVLWIGKEKEEADRAERMLLDNEMRSFSGFDNLHKLLPKDEVLFGEDS